MTPTTTSYWVTVHWPQLVDPSWQHPPSVFIQDQHITKCAIKPGDKVLVYEYASGRKLKDPKSGKFIERMGGQMGLIYAVEVIGEFQARPPGIAEQEYDDGSRVNWKWEAKTRILAEGCVPKHEFNPRIGYAAGNNLRGFEQGKGFKRIEPEQFNELLTLLRQSAVG